MKKKKNKWEVIDHLRIMYLKENGIQEGAFIRIQGYKLKITKMIREGLKAEFENHSIDPLPPIFRKGTILELNGIPFLITKNINNGIKIKTMYIDEILMDKYDEVTKQTFDEVSLSHQDEKTP